MDATAAGEQRRSAALAPVAAYAVAFFALWFCFVLVLTPRFGDGPLFLALENLAKLSIWTLPVYLLVRRGERERPLEYLKLGRGWRKGLLYGLVLGALLSLYLVAIRLPGLSFDPGFAWGKWISGVLLVGVTEEVVFRGYILQKLAARFAFRWANLVTSFLFVLIHVPRWIRDERLGLGIIGAALFLLAFSALLGWVFQRSGSLWACFLAHSISNFTSFALGNAESSALASLIL